MSTLQCQRTAYSKLAADNAVILTKLAQLQDSVAKGTGASGVRPINTELEWETVKEVSDRSHPDIDSAAMSPLMAYWCPLMRPGRC